MAGCTISTYKSETNPRPLNVRLVECRSVTMKSSMADQGWRGWVGHQSPWNQAKILNKERHSRIGRLK